ncbi:MAG: hypothetical protein DWQ44_11440 [Bacteroidetes bacterium]|nr:MAG: hypothetical protein DWQ33_09560 [Bacteroidota bacterium]REK05235.1 MAG: hypothetical protein DWQ39_08570 [Bacteroidota bacterium]REK32640.1 MAG: hypothetical protein DWQ44_11440 [Bacteroidota bacterium]REK48913.1 MAG: hypothetical protein DWQ48_08520 [Bacteroidota bacterium]
MSQLKENISIIGQTHFPAISIILPLAEGNARVKVAKDRLNTLIEQAAVVMLKKYSKQKTDEMIDRMRRTVNKIDFSSSAGSLALFVSPESDRVVHLPYFADEKVVVDSSFQVRDLIYSAKLNKNYLLVIISRNNVKTLFGYGSILLPIEFDGMPDNVNEIRNERSFPGWDYLDTNAYEEKNLKNYLRFIDEVIEENIKSSNLNLIMTGDIKILAYFRNHSRNRDRLIGEIEGNYEKHSLARLSALIEPLLNKLILQDQEDALKLLEQSVSSGNFSAGISQVWRAAAEGRGRLLLVEKDYFQKAGFGKDSYTLILDELADSSHNVVVDAVDDIIELVLKHNGDVVFFEKDTLAKFQRIAIVNRY